MDEMKLRDNFSDLSDETGFQFEFYCEHCHDAWRSEYVRYAAGTASKVLGTASSILGGVLGGASRAADGVSDAGYRSAHDKALEAALEKAKEHFFRCQMCTSYVCSQCYNQDVKLCTGCAPSVEDTANVALRSGEIDRATFGAYREGWSKDHKTAEYIVCPSCNARIAPAKYCPECGAMIEKKLTCKSCGAELKPNTKFCPECGTKV
jgi:hypothetical protein